MKLINKIIISIISIIAGIIGIGVIIRIILNKKNKKNEQNEQNKYEKNGINWLYESETFDKLQIFFDSSKNNIFSKYNNKKKLIKDLIKEKYKFPTINLNKKEKNDVINKLFKIVTPKIKEQFDIVKNWKLTEYNSLLVDFNDDIKHLGEIKQFQIQIDYDDNEIDEKKQFTFIMRIDPKSSTDRIINIDEND